MRRVACSITARTYACVPSSRSTVKKSHARMASARECRNCDQASPVCRRPGSMPLALRISQTVDAATFVPSPASSPWILRYPVGVLPSQPSGQCPDVAPDRWPAGPAARRPGGPVAADDVAAPAHDRVRGNQQPQSLTPRFQTPSRTASRARSAQSSFGRRGCRRCSTLSWWRRIKISAVFHISSPRDSRNPAATRPIRRNTNRRHMIGDHRGRDSQRATLLVKAVDEIPGTHRLRATPIAGRQQISDGLAQHLEAPIGVTRPVVVSDRRWHNPCWTRTRARTGVAHSGDGRRGQCWARW
jgi:hypothetical protein